MEIEITKEELEVVNNYIARKLTRLEDCGLEDSYCYPRLLTFRCKLIRLEEKMQDSDKICLQIKENVI